MFYQSFHYLYWLSQIIVTLKNKTNLQYLWAKNCNLCFFVYVVNYISFFVHTLRKFVVIGSNYLAKKVNNCLELVSFVIMIDQITPNLAYGSSLSNCRTIKVEYNKGKCKSYSVMSQAIAYFCKCHYVSDDWCLFYNAIHNGVEHLGEWFANFINTWNVWRNQWIIKLILMLLIVLYRGNI